jgi:hypothetical protein
MLRRLWILLATSPLAAQVAVITYHNDIFRTGQNLQETTLTPATMGGFGKLFAQSVDGQVYAQPLYVPNLPIAGKGTHNVVFIASENDSVYAFDADGNTGANAAPLWQAAFANPANGVTPVTSTDLGCTNTMPLVGITGTPVIDPETATLYVVAKTREVTAGVVKYYQRLHALNLSTGAENFGGPFAIMTSVAGTCGPNHNGRVEFSALHQFQRAGLVLDHGILFVAFASHCDICDIDPYTGWLMAFNPKTGKLLDTFNDGPDQAISYCRAGIWQAGAAPASDLDGNLFFATGNGYFNANTGGNDFGDSTMKLSLAKTGLVIADYFTPYNQASLDGGDLDLGSGGVLLLPDQPGPNPHLLAQVGKEGSIYLINRENMGKFNANGDTQIVQELANAIGGVWGMPAYFNGTVYFGGSVDSLKGFSLTNGLFGAAPSSQSTNVFGGYGPTPSVSANGNKGGIVWAVDTVGYTSGDPAVLYAYDATNLANQLFSSGQNPARDQMGPAAKFPVPTIANGKVYTGTANTVEVFGLLPNSPNFQLTATPASLPVAPGGTGNFQVSVLAEPGFSFNGTVTLSTSGLPSGVTGTFNPPSISGANSATLAVAVAGTVALGSYLLTIGGVSGTVTQNVSVTLVVTNGSPILFPNGSLTVSGTSSAGVSFTYNETLSQLDTLAFTQTGKACLQARSAYCTNGAGIVVVAGSTPVGGTSTFDEIFGTTDGVWNFGALLMEISGVSPVGTVQIFPANAQNGLGIAMPPTSLTLPSTSLASLGFSPFTVTNPTITFIVADTNYADNSGGFVLTQSPPK